MNSGKVKYTVTLPNKIAEKIDDISSDECISKPEVIRRAVSLYNYLYRDVVVNENKLCIVNGDEIIKEVVFQ